MRRALAVLASVALLAAGCGEPPVALDVPERAAGQAVLDPAGVLDTDAVGAALAAVGADLVAVAFETQDASLGEADRAGRLVLEEWGADIVLVAVAAPGDFTSADDGRRRFFGLYAADVRGVPRDLRAGIVEKIIPPLAAANDWTGAFVAAAQALATAQ